MSQESAIGNLSGGISDEDAKLVDSILNDLGQQPQQPQQPQQGQQGQQPQMTPEQQQALAQQQVAQQQMAQQQMALQQMAQQQMAQQQMSQQPTVVGSEEGTGITSLIKKEAKSIIVIVFLCIVANLGQVDSLLKNVAIFVGEDGALNLQSVFVKALLVGSLYFVIKSQFL
jgi:hypothetical protein